MNRLEFMRTLVYSQPRIVSVDCYIHASIAERERMMHANDHANAMHARALLQIPGDDDERDD